MGCDPARPGWSGLWRFWKGGGGGGGEIGLYFNGDLNSICFTLVAKNTKYFYKYLVLGIKYMLF